jgi:putative tricarboxylic transport membrane protein
MKLKNKWGAFFWIAFAGVVCLDSVHAGIGTFRFPGSGFFPFWLGIILLILGLALLVVNHFPQKQTIRDLWKGAKWGQLVFVIVLTLTYSAVLDILGYLITTFLLLATLFCMGERKGIWVKTGIALIVVLVSYVAFSHWLKVPLPKGILGY